MSQAQKGICAEPNLHAQYLVLNVISDNNSAVRQKLAEVLNIFDHYDQEHYESMVSGIVAVGTNYWPELYPGLLPQKLTPFPDMQSGDRIAPVSPCDLFIQIRADRADVCFAIASDVFGLLKPYVEMFEQIKGFRYFDGRDLTGFVDGTENPKGLHKMEVAIVGEEDADFAGGSYIHIQRYRHKMDLWNRLSLQQQEDIYGRTKEQNVEYAEADKAPFAHTKRANLKDHEGKPIEILRQSMPYGTLQEQGLFFISCCRSPKPFTLLLQSMIFGDENGQYDRLLDFTSAETGAAFFAPSVAFIQNAAK